MNTESQKNEIRKALENGERLTCLDILYRFQCLNAKGRIHDLRNEGYPVKTEMVKTRNGKRYGIFSMNPKKKFC